MSAEQQYTAPVSLLASTPCTRITASHTRTYTGLYTSAHIKRVVMDARAKVEKGEAPWAAVSVWGDVNAPESWENKEHSTSLCCESGCNDYMVVLLPNQEYWVYVMLNDMDRMQ